MNMYNNTEYDIQELYNEVKSINRTLEDIPTDISWMRKLMLDSLIGKRVKVQGHYYYNRKKETWIDDFPGKVIRHNNQKVEVQAYDESFWEVDYINITEILQ